MSSRVTLVRLRPVAASLLALLAALATLVGVTPAPAHAAAPSYVALGDSYSSGTGTRSYLADGTLCQRSNYAFPKLLASRMGYAPTFEACLGATVRSVADTQLGALGPTTRYVTISVGGNDAGFAEVLTECAQPGWMSDCHGAIDASRAFIRNTLPGRLATLYAAIRSRAPSAVVVVVGYPRLFNGEDCNAGTWFSPIEQSRLNSTADLLSSTISAAASARSFRYADPTGRFVGHAMCDDIAWINGLSYPVTESYHPNRLGHSAGYAPVVGPLLAGA